MKGSWSGRSVAGILVNFNVVIVLNKKNCNSTISLIPNEKRMQLR